MSSWCKKCDDYMLWPDSHRCTEFEVIHRDYGYDESDPCLVSASDEENAAKKYAEKRWRDDPFDPSDLDYELEINGKKFQCSAEADVNFYAKEKQ